MSEFGDGKMIYMEKHLRLHRFVESIKQRESPFDTHDVRERADEIVDYYGSKCIGYQHSVFPNRRFKGPGCKTGSTKTLSNLHWTSLGYFLPCIRIRIGLFYFVGMEEGLRIRGH